MKGQNRAQESQGQNTAPQARQARPADRTRPKARDPQASNVTKAVWKPEKLSDTPGKRVCQWLAKLTSIQLLFK